MYQITTTKIEFDLDRIEEHRYILKEAVFGPDERLIEESEYDRNGKLENRILYHYNKEGHLSETIHFNSLNELIERHSFEYSEEGWLLKSIVEYNNGSKYIKEYSFTDLGLADEVIITDENENFQGREVYVFDANGNITEEIEMDESNIEILRHTRKYNNAGLIIEETVYRDGELESRNVYDYDAIGNSKKTYRFDHQNKLAESTDYLFDMAGNLVQTHTCLTDTEFEMTEAFQYDENSNLILATARSEGKLIFHNACTFKNGKLISEEIFEKELYRGTASHHMLIHKYTAGEKPDL